MSALGIGIACTAGLFVLMCLRMHIGIAMCIAGFVGLVFLTNGDASLMMAGLNPYSQTNAYTLAIIPMFMLMGELAHYTGLTKDAYDAAHSWLGHRRGGLAMATIAGSAGFAAVCGSSLATTTTIGATALPEMRKFNYKDQFAAGAIASGGTLGILIPPSGPMVIYGIMTEQSIGKLFMAGILPGIMLAAILILTIYFQVRLSPDIAPRGPRVPWRKRLTATRGAWGVLLAFLVVIGGIYSGLFTANEAGAVGVAAVFFAAVVNRRLSRQHISKSLLDAARSTGMVFLILIGAGLFGYMIAQSGLTIALATFVGGLALPSVIVLIGMLGLFLILGCLMDTMAMLTIVVPILFPTVIKLGIDPILYGVLVVMMMEIGMLTPPVGVNCFVLSGTTGIPTQVVFKGIFPFVGAMIVAVAIIVVFPEIALFLPNALMGGG